VESAPRWWLDRAGDVAGQGDALRANGRVGNGDRGQQRFGVRVQRVGEKFVNRRSFDDLAEVHHRDMVADMSDNAQIVRDKEVSQPKFSLQIFEQVEYLRLNRDVE